MRLRTFLSNDLADLKIAQPADQPRSHHQADHERGHARGRGPERDVAHHVEDGDLWVKREQEVIQHQPNTSVRRSTTMSVRVPREPFTNTTSPDVICSAITGAASVLLSKCMTDVRGRPASIAASPIARAGSPPIVNSFASLLLAAARPHSRCNCSDRSPSSSISPSTAMRLVPHDRATTSSERKSADGLELYESSMTVTPLGSRRIA